MTLEQTSSTNDTKTSVGTDEAAADAEHPRATSGKSRRRVRFGLAKWRPILLRLLLIASVGLAAGLFYFQYRPDQRTNDAVARQVIGAASDGTVAVLTYSPDHLQRDFANARSHLTGEFLDHYKTFTDKVVAPVTQKDGVTMTAKVIRAAISDLQPQSAVVLVFVDQSASLKGKPQPAVIRSRVLVTLTKANGTWLVAKFDLLQ